MFNKTKRVNPSDEYEIERVKRFLEKFNLSYESDIDYTLVIEEEDNIIATCSKAKNIFKAFAIDENYRGEGITATLITDLIDRMFDQGIYHSFIFTKPENINIFSSLNFKLLYEINEAAIMENGIYDIDSYIDKIIKNYDIDIKEERVALVMNCNPFTNGHLYLIEEAAKECKEVIVFVVEEDKSDFPFTNRIDLVRKGTNHLKNIKVVSGGEYIISSATFPTYFLKKEDDKLNVYTKIDGGIFGKYFCSKMNIKTRYLGEEPYCNVTRAYNETLKEELKKFSINLKIVPRKVHGEEPISASRVRRLIKNENIEEVKKLVPYTTLEFLLSQKGKEIGEKLKNNSPS
ncbi:[citrate (pro-3S)-lyase] ligase [Clostridium sp.]|uniref:[citrate (pro-3S)-lyase] ligase n=1 Tax=Clostridium sp. TaxID=1506 RepID=UPI003464AADF